MFEYIYNFVQSTILGIWSYPETNLINFDEKIQTIKDEDINNLIKEVQTDIEIEKLEKRYQKLVEEVDILNENKEEEDEEDNNNNNNEGAVAVLA